jgi:hypothetical protein
MDYVDDKLTHTQSEFSSLGVTLRMGMKDDI